MNAKKAPRWTVYGIYVAEELRYIGVTKDMRARRTDHEVKLFYGERFEMRPMSTHRLRPAAMTAEKRAIRRHKPPLNRQYNEPGRGAYIHVETVRPGHEGRALPVTVRLRHGMMPVEEARAIWISDEYGSDGDALMHMTGWRFDQAYRIFGPRHLCWSPSEA